MLDFDHFTYNKSAVPKDAKGKMEFFKQLEQQFYEEIKGSDTAKEYFMSYTPDSIESFIKSYVSKKVHLSQCYEFYADEYHEKENSELYFQRKAEDKLILILQKKLFDMQLRWRAGQLDIDELVISYDFQFWENHILSCPFIPTIEKHEIDLMKGYLLSFDNEDDDFHYRNWQDYDSITEKSENGLMDDYPKWYEFYDSRMGTGALLLLPNRKGMKEEFYLDLFHQDYRKNNPSPDYAPTKSYLAGFTQEIIDFSKIFETDKYFKALFKYYNYHEEKENRDPNYDDLIEAIDFLFKADRPVHCHPHLTWDKAIIAASREYENTKIAESLNFVFEEYLMMKDLGFSSDKTLKEIKAEYDNEPIVKYYRQNILKGRMLNGEPEDFNY